MLRAGFGRAAEACLQTGKGEFEPEGRSAARFRPDPDLAIHQLDEAFADREAQARATVPPGDRCVGLRETPEQGRDLVGCDPDPGIGDRDVQAGAIGVVMGGDDDPAPFGELDRIGDQVEQDLPETVLIAEQADRRAIHFGDDLEGFSSRILLAEVATGLDEGLQIEPRCLDRELPGLDLGKVEHVVDDREQRAARVLG